MARGSSGNRHREASERLTDAAGLVTLAVGTALTVAPGRTTAALGLGLSPRVGRGIGLADLALAPGLLRARSRSRWMTGRTVVNAVLAVLYSAESRRPGGDPRARWGAVAMSVLTIVDGSVAVGLRRGAAREERGR